MAIINRFKCVKFTADWYAYPPTGVGGELTWTPTMSGSALVGGVIHGSLPASTFCDPEDESDSVNVYGLLSLQIIACKRLKIEVTGQGNGYFSSPTISVARPIEGVTILHVSGEGSDTSCPVSTSSLIPTPAYGLPNPAYIEADCSYNYVVEYEGGYSEYDNSYVNISVDAYNSFSDAYEFDVTLTLE
mgnify:CR=1 FL=1